MMHCSTRAKAEQSLVRWATSRLHDNASLAQMVDPTIAKTFISSKSLSRFADMVSVCIQPDPEFRPQMSEIVESLTCIVDGGPTAEADRSFRSTNTRFLASPNTRYHSI